MHAYNFQSCSLKMTPKVFIYIFAVILLSFDFLHVQITKGEAGM